MKKDSSISKKVNELFGNFGNYKTRIAAGAVAVVLAGSLALGIASLNNNDDKTKDVDDGLDSGASFVDPTYTPSDDYSHSFDGSILNPDDTQTDDISMDDDHINDITSTDTPEKDADLGTETDFTDNNIVQETHTHDFGDWQMEDENLEVRICNCGIKEYRNHNLSATTTYIRESSSTHLATTIYSCSECGFTKAEDSTMTCEFFLDGFDEEFEHHVCPTCHNEMNVLHNMIKLRDNLDGTITYICENDGCEYTLVVSDPTVEKDHTHQYGEQVITYKDLNSREHQLIITESCLL